jgi:4-diphosphocytidyl-2C-methyl-D-erythritol kinase
VVQNLGADLVTTASGDTTFYDGVGNKLPRCESRPAA